MTEHPRQANRGNGRERSDPPIDSKTAAARDDEYRVGPGRPPKEHQFKPGQSGNPRGAKRKTQSIAPDLKAALERALNERVKVGEREQLITKAAAGIEKLVNEFAAGDRHARRDLIAIAKILGVDLTAGRSGAIEKALGASLSTDDQALVDDYIRRRLAEFDLDAEFAARLSQRKKIQDKPEER
jgi:hypothetical protein